MRLKEGLAVTLAALVLTAGVCLDGIVTSRAKKARDKQGQDAALRDLGVEERILRRQLKEDPSVFHNVEAYGDPFSGQGTKVSFYGDDGEEYTRYIPYLRSSR